MLAQMGGRLIPPMPKDTGAPSFCINERQKHSEAMDTGFTWVLSKTFLA